MIAFVSALLLSGQMVSDAAVGEVQTPAFDRCMKTGDAGAGVTIAMLDCIADEYGRRDTLLNREYRQQMAKRGPTARQGLRRSQRAWLAARKRQCDHAGDDSEGGSLQRVEVSDCFLTEATRRTIWLKRR